MSSAKRFLLGSIGLPAMLRKAMQAGSICFLIVLVVFPQRATAVEGTLNVTASTASYSGTLTQGGNQPIRTAFGPLRLDYKSGPNTWTTGMLIREGDGNVSIGSNITSADFYSTSKLRVLGVIESTTGGFKFPDGTTQTSAASAAVGGGWTDGGTSIYTTTSTDSVGIGTTSPTQKLDVAGNITASTGFLAAYYEGTYFGRISGGVANNYMVGLSTGTPTFIIREIASQTADIMQWQNSAGTSLGVINSSGNVGIGTTSPGAKLEVVGNINSSTGALQTAGVTRIANDGVGTFAAGTTIGGSSPSTSAIPTMTVYTTNATFTVPAGITKIMVEAWGGGGAGGAGSAAGGCNGSGVGAAGGGGGGYSSKYISTSAGTQYAVVIGAGGTGGSTDSANGTSGGNTTFGAILTANGGTYGYGAGSNTSGTGGSASGGDNNYSGGKGSSRYPGVVNGISSVSNGGAGGSSYKSPGGIGGNGGVRENTVSGESGLYPGAGGGGGRAGVDCGGPFGPGGNGGAGKVIVYY